MNNTFYNVVFSMPASCQVAARSWQGAQGLFIRSHQQSYLSHTLRLSSHPVVDKPIHYSPMPAMKLQHSWNVGCSSPVAVAVRVVCDQSLSWMVERGLRTRTCLVYCCTRDPKGRHCVFALSSWLGPRNIQAGNTGGKHGGQDAGSVQSTATL